MSSGGTGSRHICFGSDWLPPVSGPPLTAAFQRPPFFCQRAVRSASDQLASEDQRKVIDPASFPARAGDQQVTARVELFASSTRFGDRAAAGAFAAAGRRLAQAPSVDASDLGDHEVASGVDLDSHDLVAARVEQAFLAGRKRAFDDLTEEPASRYSTAEELRRDVTAQMQGFPVATITPADGTGAEIGSMSIIKGARNLENAKKFYEWALTPQAQQFGAAAKQFQLPSNAKVPKDPRMTDPAKIKLINYDFAKYGSSAERRRLLAKWDAEVKNLPK